MKLIVILHFLMKKKITNDKRDSACTNSSNVNEMKKENVSFQETVNKESKKSLEYTNNLSKEDNDCIWNESMIPHFEQYVGERNCVLPLIDGVVFHKNKGSLYRCKYHNSHKCEVTIKMISDREFIYINGSSKSHTNHPIDYFNIKQKELNIKAAKLPENLLKHQWK